MKKIIAALLFVPCLVQAEFRSGNQLLNELQSTEPMNRMYALGYIVGVTDSTRGVYHCIQKDVTAGQLSDMTKNYLEANPQFRHHTADLIITAILKQAWPCANKGKGV